ncbi:hypothetical protein Goshw_028868 [Gossypium schwendimanii]|uniref:Uncharacterized protein n=1 Tax=Gossypium schwendimanii TaxID=34291 RepID=A0A7J9N5C6_GOSSC|nr:hypothetical protein [Gossypium schwendimanii]
MTLLRCSKIQADRVYSRAVNQFEGSNSGTPRYEEES